MPHAISSASGWLNDTLGTRIQKVEDTAGGAIACQIMDSLHPGLVPLKKVDFNAKNEYDMWVMVLTIELWLGTTPAWGGECLTS